MRQPSQSASIAVAGGLDAPVIATLHGETVGDGQWSEAAVARLIGSDGGFAHLATGRAYGEVMPLGFAFARVVADEAELLGIGVLPAARGHRLGRRLLDAALARAHAGGARRMVLEVRQDNSAAQALYRGAGFAAAGTRPGYDRTADGAPVDADILARPLP